MNSCPDRKQLELLLSESLVDHERLPVEEHVETCLDCQDLLETWASNDGPPGWAGRDRLRQSQATFRLAPETIERFEFALRRELLADHAPGSHAAGTRLGDYELLERIGAGGMGVVYRGRHTRLDKIVAIKLLASERAGHRAMIARFEREMRAVGRLEHPNLVRALDAGVADGMPYLVMEHVEGQDLSRLAHLHGALPIAEACELIRQAALGVQEAHEHGIIHRDIKPGNLVLVRRRHGPPLVKLLDLGLARLSEAHAPDADELTKSGQILGSLDYMAPEQGGDSSGVDTRADIYSLGATLYRLLCGQTIWSGESFASPLQKLTALATLPAPAIRSRREEIPAELAAIVHCMLARNRDDRPATAEAVAGALAPLARGADLERLFSDKFGEVARPARGGVAQPERIADSGTRTHARSSVAGVVGMLAGILLTTALFLLFLPPGGRHPVERPPDTTAVVHAGGTPGEPSLPPSRVADPRSPDTPGTTRSTKVGNVAAGNGKYTGRFALWFPPNGDPTITARNHMREGTEYRVTVPSLPHRDFLDKTITFETWVKRDPKTERAHRIVFGFYGEFCIATDAVGEAFLVYGGVPEFHHGLDGLYRGDAAEFDWTHVAVVRDMEQPETRLYVDGRFVGKAAFEPHRVPGNQTVLQFAPQFVGLIGETRVSSIARFDRPFTPRVGLEGDRHTIALYQFEEGQGDVLIDSSGNDHHGEIIGAEWVTVNDANTQAGTSVTESGVRQPASPGTGTARE